MSEGIAPEELAATDPERQVASMGRTIADWMENEPVGIFVTQKAMDAVGDALEKLKDADVEDVKLMRKLQNEAKVPEMVLQWFRDAILEGHEAVQILENMEAESHDT